MQQFRKGYLKRALALLLALSICISMITVGQSNTVSAAAVLINTGYKADAFGTLLEECTQFVVVKHKQLGGSHYAYTDGLSDEIGSPEGNESVFNPGSEMVLVTLKVNSSGYVTRTEKDLLASPNGVIRDPDVSEDGTRVIFSWKKDSADDFHLYEMTIKDSSYKQLTFGSGVADVEPKYAANGKIIFSSTRCISNVDCWKIAVMNLYTCDADGSNIMRLGYDQVHTTYPTTTEDGRILYTRWDYNDRNQMYIQSVFQMFPDGTNQTELYGNDSNFPTTLLHTREVPGSTGVYVSISSGHHTKQAGKLVLLDTNIGRNDKDAVTYPFPDEYCDKNDSIDPQGQLGDLYKYPVALNDHEFLVSYCAGGWDNGGDVTTQFGIYYMNSETGDKICISDPESGYGASQVAMVKTKDLFQRPSMVNRAVEYGTYYMGDVYEGGGLEGVEEGEAKYLRVVELEYRPYAIGATIGRGTGTSDPYTPVSTGNGSWDVKRVLGIVDIEADGSALFRVPADTPVYFQVLNADGEMIQSMRSWSTLMPNETFSCVGCHEDKNTVPPHDSTTTLAMKKGVQELKPDLWMTEEDGSEYEEGEYDVEEDTGGFSYTEQVQPILDANCISCHNDQNVSYEMISGSSSNEDVPQIEELISLDKDGIALVDLGSDFKYTMTTQNGNAWRTSDYNALAWGTGAAPFGCRNIAGHPTGTFLDVDGQNVNLYMRKDFTLSASDYNNLAAYDVYLRIFYDENPAIYLNGTQIYSVSGWVDNGYVDVNISEAFAAAAVSGNNELAAYCANAGGGMFMDFGIYLVPKATLIASGSSFKYTTTRQRNTNWIAEGFNDASWNTGNAPFGDITIDGNAPGTELNVPNLYLRSSFALPQTVYDRIQSGEYDVYMDIAWDEEPVIYLNGTQIFSETSYTTSYKKRIEITNAFINAMQEGTNTLAAYLANNAGSQFIDFEIYLVCDTALVSKGSNFRYTTTEQDDNNWITENYDDSAWENGNAPFGNDTIEGNAPNTNLNVPNLYLRSSFNLTQGVYDKIQNGEYDVYLNISWDEDPVLYLNGTQIFTETGYTTFYETIEITTAFKNAMKVGDNTLAASLINLTGGQFLDFAIFLSPTNFSGNVFSLENIAVQGPREKIFYSLSYLVLTDSDLTDGIQYVGNSTNNYTNWISSMSKCEMLEPYQYGSTKSNMITMLKNGHQGVTLSEKEMQILAAWIDLGVPFRGAYDESTNWGINENREETEKQNKRDYYEALDIATKRISTSSVDTDKLPITVSYTTGGGSEIVSVTDNGLAYLYPETKYTAGYKVTVTLPEGVTYFFLGLDSRVGETLIYCPSGTYTYTIPSNASSIFPATFSNAAHPTITARIATVEELAETRNLAVNPYDVSTNAADAAAYPHASASTQYNSIEYAARNAIDGAAVNEGHGNYPLQSWGAAEADSDMYYEVNFGTEVCVSSVDIAVRADWSSNHDTYFTGAVLEFSDGTTQNITLTKDSDMQSFAIEGGVKETSYVRISSMETAGSEWAGLSEVEVYGTVYPDGEIPLMNVTIDEAVTLDVGESQTLTVTYLPEDTTENSDAAWSSSDESVVVVNSNGTIVALKEGTATITLTVGDIVKTCVVTVNDDATDKFDIYAANMRLGNDLSMFFYVEKADLEDGENYTAKIIKTYADGRESIVEVIPYAEWEVYQPDTRLMRFGFDGIAAKEMFDKVYIVIYNSKGVAVSNVWIDSVSDYATRAIEKTTNTDSKRLMVDMLNYGAVAQEYFAYDTENLANSRLTEEQKALATETVTYTDKSQPDDNYVGSTLFLENSIMLNLYFDNINPSMTAYVTYENHYGEAQQVTIPGSDFVYRAAENIYGVSINTLVVADGRQMVKVEVKDASGNLIASATDSVESYIARATEKHELYSFIMKFADSAYTYLHNK